MGKFCTCERDEFFFTIFNVKGEDLGENGGWNVVRPCFNGRNYRRTAFALLDVGLASFSIKTKLIKCLMLPQ